MINTRIRKILRDILSRKGRTAMVAASIMIGVFGVVALVSVNALVLGQLDHDINEDELPMSRLYVTVPSAGTVPDNQAALNAISELPGVTHVEGNAFYPVYWKPAGEDTYTSADILAYSAEFEDIQLEPMRLLEGHYPQADQHEVVIDTRFAEGNGVDIGDQIIFRPLGSDVEPVEWTVSGIVFHPYFVVIGGDDADGADRIFARYEDAQQIAGFAGFSQFSLRYTDAATAKASVNALKGVVAEQTDYISMFDWTEDPDDYFLFTAVSQVTDVLNLLAVVAMVVSGFLVTNVINTIVTEQKRQIGVLKSMGATRIDIFKIYAGSAIVYGILGVIPGVILGAIVGGLMAQSLAPLAFTWITGFKVSPVGVGLGISMGLLVPVIAALIPIFNATRVTIISAMTDLGISSEWGKSRLARWIGRIPLPMTTRQALSNVVQKRGRLALTTITLTLAAASFMGIFAMFSSVTVELERLFDSIDFDLQVSPTQPRSMDEMEPLLHQVEDVADIYPSVGFSAALEGYTSTNDVTTGTNLVNVLGIDTTSDTWNIDYAEGTGWKDDPERSGIVLTTVVAENINKSAGDVVVLTVGGESHEFEVIGVFDFPEEFIMMRWQEVATLAGFVNDNGDPLPTSFSIRLNQNDPSARDVDKSIGRITDVLMAEGITAAYTNQVEELNTITESFQTFNMIFQIASAVMAAVGAIGLLTTLSMAVYERQKEIGVMRSIGAGSMTITFQFLVEGILVGVLAWIIAMPLSVLLAKGLYDSLGFDFFPFSYPVSTFGLGLIGMLVIATVASLWPSLAAARKTVSDILRYQ